MRFSSLLAGLVASAALASVSSVCPDLAAAAKEPRKPAELFFGFGPGGAACDKNKPDSDCPVDGALALDLGGSYRFHGHFAVGAELGFWGYKVRESWKGNLKDPAVDVKFSSMILAPFARWYWFEDEPIDAYLQLGIGFGSFHGAASNATDKYTVDVSGVVIPLGIGAEYIATEHFRFGLQFLPYLQISSKLCEKVNDADQTCHRVGSESNALPWRLILVGTVLL
jgi:hypothetical protein